MLLKAKFFTDFFQIPPQNVKLKNRISFFALNYFVIHNTSTHYFYVSLWVMEDFFY